MGSSLLPGLPLSNLLPSPSASDSDTSSLPPPLWSPLRFLLTSLLPPDAGSHFAALIIAPLSLTSRGSRTSQFSR